MKIKKSLLAMLTSACLCMPALAHHGPGKFHNKFYIGGSGGISRVDPEVIGGQNLTVDENTSEGGKVFIGWDFRPHMALEFALADLGEADIGPNDVGEVEYRVANLSFMYHFFNAGGYQRLLDRQGFGAFWKIGIGGLDNDSELDVTRRNDVHASAGVGVEYGTRIGFAVRGEVEAFDEDAALASVGVLWRFGRNALSSGAGLVAAGGAAVGLGGDDDDSDGVPNNLDDCPDTPADDPVTPDGCAMFGGVLNGVNFASGSDELTDEAQSVLNDAADSLLRYPNVNVEVQAHTDSQGAADYNLALSKQRALSTVRYLILRGVPSEQLQARAYGESKPLESNDTAEGRTANRRVEFHRTDL